MGPHSFKCGKLGCKETNISQAILLQWGRTLSSAESPPVPSRDKARFKASMGPHSFKCGKFVSQLILDSGNPASMGPHSFKCGKLLANHDAEPSQMFASMGPHSFKCGKSGESIGKRKLQ